MDPICFDLVALRINLHLGRGVVEFHIFLADGPTVLYGFHALLQVVRPRHPRFDACLADKRDGGFRNCRRKHGAHDDWLDGGNRGIRITLGNDDTFSKRHAPGE
jgi:hypothetical protein